MQEGSEAFARLAQDYARFRPGYPVAILQELADACGLTPAWAVADIGSGTGNLARLFLDAGHTVVGIEPNRQMREAGERHLAPYPAFRSLDGSAEDIPLPPQSVDLVTVGQALHWFDIERAKGEFRRILRGGRQVAVAWNDRRPDPEGFFEAYRALTRDCLNHVPTSFQRPLSAGLDRLFEVAAVRHASFDHMQAFDLEGFLGRARSSGYRIDPDMAARLGDLFSRYQQRGTVVFHYRMELYIGQL